MPEQQVQICHEKIDWLCIVEFARTMAKGLHVTVIQVIIKILINTVKISLKLFKVKGIRRVIGLFIISPFALSEFHD